MRGPRLHLGLAAPEVLEMLDETSVLLTDWNIRSLTGDKRC